MLSDTLTDGPIGSRRSSKTIKLWNGRVNHFHALNGATTSYAMASKMIVAGKSVLERSSSSTGNKSIMAKIYVMFCESQQQFCDTATLSSSLYTEATSNQVTERLFKKITSER